METQHNYQFEQITQNYLQLYSNLKCIIINILFLEN